MKRIFTVGTITVSDNPGRPLPARALLILMLLFFVVPGLICAGCMASVPLWRGQQKPPALPLPSDIPQRATPVR